MSVVIVVQGLAGGIPTPFDGQMLAEYDPDRPGRDPTGQPMLATVRTTRFISEALTFPTAVEAWALWRQESTRVPRRPDGLPNRPLTAFTIEIVGADDARDRYHKEV